MIGRERGRGPLGRGGRGSDEIAESAARMRNDLKNRFSNKIQTFITIIYVITKYLVSCLSDAWSDDVDTVTCEWLSQPRHCQTAGLHQVCMRTPLQLVSSNLKWAIISYFPWYFVKTGSK